MMKIYKKRTYADRIDVAVYILFLTIVAGFFPSHLLHKDFLFYLLIFYPINLSDFVFKGASIGKKIMGIRLYDKNWKSPSYKLLFRSRIHIGFVRHMRWKHRLHPKWEYYDTTFLDIIDLEREKYGIRLVDNKVFKRLSEEAKLREGRWEDNMSRMYDEYIMCVYSK